MEETHLFFVVSSLFFFLSISTISPVDVLFYMKMKYIEIEIGIDRY